MKRGRHPGDPTDGSPCGGEVVKGSEKFQFRKY